MGTHPLWILTPGTHTPLGTHQLNTDPLYVPTSLGTHPPPPGIPNPPPWTDTRLINLRNEISGDPNRIVSILNHISIFSNFNLSSRLDVSTIYILVQSIMSHSK